MSNDSHNTIHDFIRHLLSATANASLYGVTHPQVARLSLQAFASIEVMLQSRPEITLMVVDNELVIDEQPQELSLFLNRFTQILKARGIGTRKLLEGLTKSEVDSLISALAKQLEDAAQSMTSSDHIRLGTVDINISGISEDGSSDDSHLVKLTLQDMPREELSKFLEIYNALKNKRKLQINGVVEVVSGFINLFRKEGKPLLAMAALRDADEYSFTHSTNVCVLNLAQSMALGINGQLLNDIGVASMLHDIGKLLLPEEILTKAEILTDDDFAIMKQHPVLGARHLLETPAVPRLASIVAYEHHMKYNFSGYPVVEDGWQQNLCSHMTTISDFFDAMRTRRSYREPVPLPDIAAMMQSMIGTELHPALTRNFLRIMAELDESAP